MSSEFLVCAPKLLFLTNIQITNEQTFQIDLSWFNSSVHSWDSETDVFTGRSGTNNESSLFESRTEIVSYVPLVKEP